MTDAKRNPFMVEQELFGRPNTYLDLAGFAEALAKELGETADVRERGPYAIAGVSCANGVHLHVAGEYGAKFGRVAVSARIPAEDTLDHHERTKLPRITVDSARPLQALAKDIRRRVLEPAAEALKASADTLKAVEDRREALAGHVAKLRETFPGLQVTPDERGDRASLYFNNSDRGGYITGTLYADGRMCLDRVVAYTDAACMGVLAAIAGGGAK